MRRKLNNEHMLRISMSRKQRAQKRNMMDNRVGVGDGCTDEYVTVALSSDESTCINSRASNGRGGR